MRTGEFQKEGCHGYLCAVNAYRDRGDERIYAEETNPMDGLPPPLPRPTGHPTYDLGQAPDRAYFLYGLSCVSMGISIAAGLLAAILHWKHLPPEALVILLAIMAGTASLTAFICGTYAHHVRNEDLEKMARAQQQLIAFYEGKIQEIEDEREPLIERVRSETIAMMERAEQAAYAQWTPEIVAQHVSVTPNTVAIFEQDNQIGKPIILIDWLIASGAHVPCDVFITGGTCTVFTLPTLSVPPPTPGQTISSPGRAVCRLDIKEFVTSFDGKLAPNAILVHKTSRIELTGRDVAELHSSLSTERAARLVIELQGVIKTCGVNHSVNLGVYQPLIEFRPWLRATPVSDSSNG